MTSNTAATIAKWRRLTDLIVELTYNDRLIWKESVNDDEYLTTISGNILKIEKSLTFKNGEDIPLVRVTISSDQGKKIDEFDDMDIEEAEFKYYRKLDDLIGDIGRKVSGADSVLDEILGDLEKKADPF